MAEQSRAEQSFLTRDVELLGSTEVGGGEDAPGVGSGIPRCSYRGTAHNTASRHPEHRSPQHPTALGELPL